MDEVRSARPPAPQPMLATLGKVPASSEGYSLEFKHDGQRGTAVATPGAVWLFSRNGADVTATFPEVTTALSEALPSARRQVVLDGEIVALDREGRPSFTRLQRRWPQNRRPSLALLQEVPVRLFVFDVMAVDDHDVTGMPYWRRRELLEELLGDVASPTLVVPPAFTDVSPAAVLEVAAEHQYEGILCKRLTSTYRPGRSSAWTKVPARMSSEVVIVGLYGSRSRGVGAVLVAAHDSTGELRLLGRVGSGFASKTRRELYALLSEHRVDASPIRDAVEDRYIQWVAPAFVAEVAYREYIVGQGLRHASWKGLRPTPEKTVTWDLPH